MKLDYQESYARHLPHIQPPGATLFVTFRLAGSLPLSVIDELEAELKRDLAHIRQTADPANQPRLLYEAQRRAFGRLDRELDKAGHGPRWLQQPAIASLVQESIHFLDGQKYALDCYCLLSNHGHIVFTPLEEAAGRYFAISGIMHSLKRHTATEANKRLGRKGQFWQHESYDHIVRDEAELNRIRRYVLMNPVKAGLIESETDWPYSWASW